MAAEDRRPRLAWGRCGYSQPGPSDDRIECLRFAARVSMYRFTRFPRGGFYLGNASHYHPFRELDRGGRNRPAWGGNRPEFIGHGGQRGHSRRATEYNCAGKSCGRGLTRENRRQNEAWRKAGRGRNPWASCRPWCNPRFSFGDIRPHTVFSHLARLQMGCQSRSCRGRGIFLLLLQSSVIGEATFYQMPERRSTKAGGNAETWLTERLP